MAVTDLVFIDDAGYHTADYPSFLAFLQAQYQSIYGADVYLGSDSQDGQWVAIQAQALFDVANLGGSVFNSFSPVTAQGVGLSRNVKIVGISRQAPTNSTVELVIVGQSGTVILNGVATDSLNNKWDLPASVLIPLSGTITVTATCEALGSIAAVANSINIIFTPQLGWQSVNNPAVATLGAPVETDAQLRRRQIQSVADPSLTVFEGTIGGVENLPGVTKVRGYENDTSFVDANGLPAHSIAVVVAGGTDTDIANEIMLHKTPGTETDGTTSVPVLDNHGMPLIINFYRPTIATVQATITISVNEFWSADYIVQIQDAVAAVINATEIGGTILITKLYGPAYLTGTPQSNSFDIASITLGKNGGSQTAANVDLTFLEEAVTDPLVDVVVVIT